MKTTKKTITILTKEQVEVDVSKVIDINNFINTIYLYAYGKIKKFEFSKVIIDGDFGNKTIVYSNDGGDLHFEIDSNGKIEFDETSIISDTFEGTKNKVINKLNLEIQGYQDTIDENKNKIKELKELKENNE